MILILKILIILIIKLEQLNPSMADVLSLLFQISLLTFILIFKQYGTLSSPS